MGIAGNSRLEKRARRLMGKVRMKSRKTGKTETLFGETRYAARKWSHRRRVIIKAEVVRYPGRDPKDNDRFVVTNLPHKPENVYKIYRGRGDAENRIKELHHGLEIDRTSCTSFLANQLRVFMTAAADVLMQEMRARAAGTALGGSASIHPERTPAESWPSGLRNPFDESCSIFPSTILGSVVGNNLPLRLAHDAEVLNASFTGNESIGCRKGLFIFV